MIVRRATVDDAARIAAVMNAVIAEGDLTLFDRPFSEAQERAFIASLGSRSVLHVAEIDGEIVGVQSVDLYSSLSASLAHVATMGTWLRADARGRGIGRALAERSFAFARTQGYQKIFITVLAGNIAAQRFYSGLGFELIGVAKAHVQLKGEMHDELLMEKSLRDE